MANRQDLAIFLNSLSGLGDALRKMRDEKIQKELLEQIDPEYSGEPLTAYKFRRSLEDENLNREYKRAQIERTLRPARDPNAERVPIELPDGRTVNVTGNMAAEYYRRQNAPANKDAWSSAIPIARGRLATQADVDAKMAAEQGSFTNQYTGAEQGDQIQLQLPNGRVTVPFSSWEARQQRQPQPRTKAQYAEQVAPEAAPEANNEEQAKQIREDYRAKRITREEAKARLQALGFE